MRETSCPDLPELLLAEHGGDLFAARRAYPQAPEPWLDLSTGINPYAYPFASPPLESFTRLPQRDALRKLEAAARAAYRAPAFAEIVAAPGSQTIINLLPHLVPARCVGILGVTYCEHARSWAASGAELSVVADLSGLEHKRCSHRRQSQQSGRQARRDGGSARAGCGSSRTRRPADYR
jgi:histidinol-phosphate/aromatic aminotransferase/cobyric acid decarboxylase-like protein